VFILIFTTNNNANPINLFLVQENEEQGHDHDHTKKNHGIGNSIPNFCGSFRTRLMKRGVQSKKKEQINK
jgi:hypothetical protein